MMREIDRVIVATSSLALTAPSAFTIGWSKEQHPEQMPILYAGIGASALTVLGAILGDRHHGNAIMWVGVGATVALFGYVTFVYKPPSPTV